MRADLNSKKLGDVMSIAVLLSLITFHVWCYMTTNNASKVLSTNIHEQLYPRLMLNGNTNGTNRETGI